jgi:hypothetical protein
LSPAPASTGPRSALDLWHPTGAPRRRLALGRSAPALEEADPGGPVDIAVIAPDAEEISSRWLGEAIPLAAARLDANAVLWVIGPRRWRRRAERDLREAGLALLDSVLTVPPWPDSAHLVPLSPATLRHAGPRHLGLSPMRATCAAALAQTGPGRALLRRAAPGCALLAARRPAPEPLRWLAKLDGNGVPGTATASLGPRTDAQVAVVLRFTSTGRSPDLVVKAALDAAGGERLKRERAALAELGPEATRAGAAIPLLLPAVSPWLLATNVLPGRAAATELARDPKRIETIVGAVATWLRSWTASTASNAVASQELLDRTLLAPARRVAEGDGKAEYVEALQVLGRRMEGRALVLTAAHNDLTMSNVLIAGDRLGIVDWEQGANDALPLLDLWYALADAVARARRITHAHAVETLVANRARGLAALTRIPAEHARALALSTDQALLAFHACWLHHAANELDRGVQDGPFLEVLRTVAAKRLSWPAPEHSLAR